MVLFWVSIYERIPSCRGRDPACVYQRAQNYLQYQYVETKRCLDAKLEVVAFQEFKLQAKIAGGCSGPSFEAIANRTE